MNDTVKVDIKKSYNKNGIVINQKILKYLISNPNTYFNITIKTLSFNEETNRHFFKKTCLLDTFSEIHKFIDVDICKLDYPCLGNFIGPILFSVAILLDEEIALYLKMKGII